MDLLGEITRCPNIQHWFASSQSSNPCSKIILTQNVQSIESFQVPEPWSGNLQLAPILFLSSNPSIDEMEEIPNWSWPDEWIEDFYQNRYGGGRKQWIANGKHTLMLDGSRKAVRYWIEIRQRAKELLVRDVQDGIDYALTEVVHCKSQGEGGVKEALHDCARRYLRRVVELSGARIIVTLGSKIKNTVKDEFRIHAENMSGPHQIGEHQRYIVFLPHPNAHMHRSFEKCLEAAKLQELRDFLRS